MESSDVRLAEAATAAQQESAVRDGRLNIIDNDMQLTTELKEWIDSREALRLRGFDYHIVSILGSQSTGKSTLLNLLFGTAFDVMASKKRQQTTQGIWLSTTDLADVLVMDVEGTDGRERGESQAMANKSALFSLATSDVLLINMFEKDIGRYNGANYGLLKVVFEVNLNKFLATKPARTGLLFVIRDCEDLDNLSENWGTLQEDMNTIFNELKKPEALKNAVLSDFFDLHFVGLPHKVYREEEFKQQVALLRERFVPNSPDYLFKSEFHKGVPLDGLSTFVKEVWASIMNEKDLDLPAQRLLMAQFRCAEINSSVLNRFRSDSVPSLESAVSSTAPIANCCDRFADVFVAAMASYDQQASHYDEATAKAERAKLANLLQAELRNLFVKYMHKASAAAFEPLEQRIKAASEHRETFAKNAEEAEADALAGFDRLVKYHGSSSVDEATLQGIFVADEVRQLLVKRIQERVEVERVSLVHKLQADYARLQETEVRETVLKALETGDVKSMWETIRQKVDSAAANTRTRATKGLQEIGAVNHTERVVKELLRSLCDGVVRILRDQTVDSIVMERMVRRYSNAFRFDEHGVARIWRPDSPFEDISQHAENVAKELLRAYATAALSFKKLDVDDAAVDKTLIDEARVAFMERHLESEAKVQVLTARMAAKEPKVSLPYWVYFVFLLLGYDELLSVMSFGYYYLIPLLLVILFFLFYTKAPMIDLIDGLTGGWIASTRAKIRSVVGEVSHGGNSTVPATREALSSAVPMVASGQKAASRT